MKKYLIFIICQIFGYGNNINISGDLEFVHNIQDNIKIHRFNEAKIGLNMELITDNEIKIFTRLQFHDDILRKETYRESTKIKYGYFNAPFINNLFNIEIGLIPNYIYGTNAFEDGHESYYTNLYIPLTKTKIFVLGVEKNPEEKRKKNYDYEHILYFNLSDTLENFKYGIKYNITFLKEINEKFINHRINAFIIGKIHNIDVGLELNYLISDLSKEKADERAVSGQGIYLSASKDINNFNIGSNFTFIRGGMTIGTYFEAGIITFGDEALEDTLKSTIDKSSYILAFPVEYQFNKKLSFSTAFLLGNNQSKIFQEYNLGIAYELYSEVELSAGYATRSPIIKDEKIQKNIFFQIDIKF